MKNPYGVNTDGVLVLVSDVEKGLRCNCTCPACRHPLQAHQGRVRKHYFSHYSGADCGAAYETALHMLAKDVIAEEGKILLPKLIATSDLSIARKGTTLERETVVRPWIRQVFDSVVLEQREGSFTPDVSLVARDRRLFVEIRVTHEVDEQKLIKLVTRGIGTVEFDFRDMNRVVTRQDIRHALIETYTRHGMGRGRWIYHPKESAVVERLTGIYRERIYGQRRRTAVGGRLLYGEDP